MDKKYKLYKDIDLYDFDAIEERIADLYESGLTKEGFKLQRYIRDAIFENPELYEMANNRNEYIRQCTSMADPINFTIANIICLEESCPEMVLHWRRELLTFTNDLIGGSYNKCVKKDKLIDTVIDKYSEPYKYNHRTYTDALIYEKAMEDEIKKANRPTATPLQIRLAKYIKSEILPIVDEYVDPNKERVSYLFDKLVEACKHTDTLIFKNAVEKFINWKI